MRYHRLLLGRLCFAVAFLQTLLPVEVLASAEPAVEGNGPPDPTATATATENNKELIDWVRSRDGGYYNPKQERRSSDTSTITGTSSARSGMYATDTIEKGERLLVVSWSSIIGAADVDKLPTPRSNAHAKDVEDEGDYREYMKTKCAAVRGLLREVKLGDASKFRPHVHHLLQDQQPELGTMRIPTAWSEEGRNLLEDTNAGGQLPPAGLFTVINFDQYGYCIHDWDDPLEVQVAQIVASQWSATHGLVVPLFDYYNVRNGKWTNVQSNLNAGKNFEVVATRRIEVGEQIYCSYGKDSHSLNLFRDYGIIEEYPQTFPFEEYGVTLKVDIEDSTGELTLTFDEDDDYEVGAFNSFLVPMLSRLERLKVIATSHGVGLPQKSTLSEYEWDMAWRYHTTLTDAIRLAIEIIQDEGEDIEYCPSGKEREEGGTCPIWDGGYEELGDDPITDLDLEYDEDWPYGPSEFAYSVCNDVFVNEFEGYHPLGRPNLKSHYQGIEFFHNPETKDVCMNLDGTTQQCTSYRPHYHEFAVHFPARFIETVRRVLFVGGGDSMVLYDVLQYPSLELVVGLELDQYVVRYSFKVFHTQPHFDDKRVQWWFGDGAKSLLMLPREYFGTFDLVVVDLSETVISFQVTNELSIFQTLSLLLKPDGIMLKNGEYYMDDMSHHFDYTLQYFEFYVPYVCDQGMVIGSNSIDFFNRFMKDHGVKTMVLEPQDEINERFNPYHRFTEYRKNDARKQGQCEDSNSEVDLEGREAGILMIVEAENLSGDLKATGEVEKLLRFTLEEVGLSFLSTVSSRDDASTIVVVMREGYVRGRLWPELSYFAIDIQLWGSFQLMEAARDALVKVLGGTESSSFRIVDGGMHGSSTKLSDRKLIGPRIVQNRNCDLTLSDDSDVRPTESTESILMESALEESLHLVEDDIVAAVVCGVEGGPCKSLGVLRKAEGKISAVVPIWTCSSIGESSAQFTQDFAENMVTCEVDIIKTLGNAGKKVSLLVVDPNAQEGMMKVLLGILGGVWNRKRLFSSHRFAILVPTVDVTANSSEVWRRNFLLHIREKILFRPISFVDLVIKGSIGSGRKMSALSINDPEFFLHLKEVTSRYNALHADRANMDVESIYDGLATTQIGPFRPRTFLPDDYDQLPAKEQQQAQKSLGRQTLFQLEIVTSSTSQSDSSVSTAFLRRALEESVSSIKDELIDVQHFTDVGDGLLAVAIMSEGSAAVVWDGQSHIDINLFCVDESASRAKQFLDAFRRALGATVPGQIKLALRDTFPRGIGRVINFELDK